MDTQLTERTQPPDRGRPPAAALSIADKVLTGIAVSKWSQAQRQALCLLYLGKAREKKDFIPWLWDRPAKVDQAFEPLMYKHVSWDSHEKKLVVLASSFVVELPDYGQLSQAPLPLRETEGVGDGFVRLERTAPGPSGAAATEVGRVAPRAPSERPGTGRGPERPSQDGRERPVSDETGVSSETRRVGIGISGSQALCRQPEGVEAGDMPVEAPDQAVPHRADLAVAGGENAPGRGSEAGRLVRDGTDPLLRVSELRAFPKDPFRVPKHLSPETLKSALDAGSIDPETAKSILAQGIKADLLKALKDTKLRGLLPLIEKIAGMPDTRPEGFSRDYENRLMARALSFRGTKGYGGLWRKRVWFKPSKMEKIMAYTAEDEKAGRIEESPGQHMFDLWFRFAD